MKATLQAAFAVTICAGNVVDIAVAAVDPFQDRVGEKPGLPGGEGRGLK